MNNINESDSGNFQNKGTQGTSLETKKALNHIYKALEEINFRLHLHPNSQELIHEIRKENSSEKNIQDRKEGDIHYLGSNVEIPSNIKSRLEDIDVRERDYNLIATLGIIEKAEEVGYPIGAKNGSIYIFTGTHWATYQPDVFKRFLEKCYLRTGVPMPMAKRALFLKQGLDQFEESALIMREQELGTYLNLQNGTLVFGEDGHCKIRDHDAKDFITYVLPYKYDKDAECPMFQQYLDYVVPEKDKQRVLAEFVGSVFSDLKHEKVLILFGSGRNGKSVFLMIVTALLGSENVCSHTLESLTDSNLYFIGDLADSLLNFSGEISTKVNPDMFKKLASGEKVTARYPYGRPFEVESYARLAFNCNELPQAEETTEGFFRRFLIIPFDVYIPYEKVDPNLAEKIIESELTGIINWVIEGLKRLEINNGFSYCESAERALREFKKESDPVSLFLEDNLDLFSEPWKSSDLYQLYDEYCRDFELSKLGTKKFAQQLKSKGIHNYRKADGVYYDVHEYQPNSKKM